MRFLNTVDYAVIATYSLILIVMGFYLQRRAAQNIESYFLGGKKLPWWALGVSGMLNFLDMTGTMVIVSFLYILGPRGLFIEFRGGAVLVLAFMMCYTGKWHRRSNCMTGAEYNIYRFGAGRDAQTARLITAIAVILFTFGQLAYLTKGAGIFLSMFIPFSLDWTFNLFGSQITIDAPMTCALGMVALTTMYTITAGFIGVVYTDIFQSVIILVSVVVITIMAITQVAHNGNLPEVAAQVTGSQEWMSSLPHWNTMMPEGYKQYEYLFLFAMFYLFRNILGGMATGADPRYFGARNERECGLLSFLWTWLMTFRWPMMMGFAVMGIYLIHQTFPDQQLLTQSAAHIRDYFGEVPKHLWEGKISTILLAPERYPELVQKLQGTLGDEWTSRLLLVSHEGTVNPERVLPAVILMRIPLGLRGLLVVSLVAAAMSTFSPIVNIGVSMFTRDIYQAFLRKRAKNFELIAASYMFGVFVVMGGLVMAYSTKSINEIWDWIIMGLGTGIAIPGLLKLYWWRFNAMGVVFGTAAGVGGAMIDRGLATFGFFEWLNAQAAASEMFNWFKWNSMWEFSVLTVMGTVGCIVGTFLTKPTDYRVLEHYYRTTRPFGWWKRFHYVLDPEQLRATKRENFYDIISVPFALLWQITLFILPMQVVIGAWREFWPTLGVFIFALTGLMIFWYRNLPPARDGVPDGGDLELVKSFYDNPILPGEPAPETAKV